MSSEKSIVKPRKSARSAAKQAAAAAMTAEPTSPTAKLPHATAAANDASHPKAPRMGKGSAMDTGIRDTDLDLVSDDLYGKLKDEVVMELLEGLRTELTPMYNEAISSQGGSSLTTSSSTSSCGSEAGSSSAAAEDLLWNLRATPAMMQSFSATVRATQPSAVEAW